MRPDTIKFTSDLENSRVKEGIFNGKWGILSSENGWPDWPSVFIWISAAERENSPDKYYFKLDLLNYPSQAPLICIWDIANKAPLIESKRPSGGETITMLFRTNWEGGNHLYAPYERRALATHPNWISEYPSLCWKPTDTILKVLEDILYALHSADYHGSK